MRIHMLSKLYELFDFKQRSRNTIRISQNEVDIWVEERSRFQDIRTSPCKVNLVQSILFRAGDIYIPKMKMKPTASVGIQSIQLDNP